MPQPAGEVVRVQIFLGKDPETVLVPLQLPFDKEETKRVAKQRFQAQKGLTAWRGLRAQISRAEEKRIGRLIEARSHEQNLAVA